MFVVADVAESLDGRRTALVYSFEVRYVRRFRAADVELRALQVRRLDALPWDRGLLGFSSPHLRDAVVLLDHVERLLVSYVLPALPTGAALSLIDPASADPGALWQRRLAAGAGAAISASWCGSSS